MSTLYDENGNEVEVEDAGSLRQKLEEAEKRAKDAEKARVKVENELAPIRAQQKEQAVNTAFTEAGLTEREAKVFLRLNPDVEVTPEAIQAFAEEFEFAPKSEEEATTTQTPVPPAPPATMRPTVDATPVGVTSSESWSEFMGRVSNPATHDQALKDFADGRVETQRKHAFQKG